MLRALVALDGVRRCGRGARCATPARTSWRRTAPSDVEGRKPPGDRAVRRQRDALAGRPHRHRRPSAGRGPTDRRSTTTSWSSPVTAAGVDARRTGDERRLVAQRRRRTLPDPAVLAAERSRSASTSSSTTSSQQLLHRRSTATLLKACCQAVGCSPDEKITRQPRRRPVADAAPAHHLPRLPRLPDPVTRHDDPTTEPAAPSTPRCPAAASSPARSRWPAQHPRSARPSSRASAASAAARASVLVVLSLRGACRRPLPGGPARRPRLLPGPAAHRDPRGPAAGQATACSACTPRSRRWCRCGRPASWPPSTRPGCRRPTARTSPRWRSSRTPTPAPRPAWAGSTA